jgi:hypothetical protein
VDFEEGLAVLEKGISRGKKINQEINTELTVLNNKQLESPDMDSKGFFKLRTSSVIQEMKYHYAGCLKGMGREEEGKIIFKELKKEGVLKDLKREDKY